jgi:hypothetical protein
LCEQAKVRSRKRARFSALYNVAKEIKMSISNLSFSSGWPVVETKNFLLASICAFKRHGLFRQVIIVSVQKRQHG